VNGNIISIASVTNADTVVGEFRPSDVLVRIDVANPSGGSFTFTVDSVNAGPVPASGWIKVPFNSSITITAVPNAGYEFAWVNNPYVDAISGTNGETVEFVVRDSGYVFEGAFTLIEYDVTMDISNSDFLWSGGRVYVAIEGSFGTKVWAEVFDSDVLKVPHGTQLEVKVVPDEGYEFLWCGGSTKYEWPGEYSFDVNVVADDTLTVVFSLMRFDVFVYPDDPLNGSIFYMISGSWPDVDDPGWLPFDTSKTFMYGTLLWIKVPSKIGHIFI
jgi:hypothetical protein